MNFLIQKYAFCRASRNALGIAFCSLANTVVFPQDGTAQTPAVSPQRQLLAALTDLAAKQPRHVGAIYVAARTAAALGDEQTAFYWLDKLAEIGLDDEIDPDDFGPLTLTPGFLERAARFADKARPIGSASQLLELQCSNLLPEGTAFDSKRDELLISSGRRRTIVAVDARGNCRDVVPEGDGALFAVLGMHVDPSNDSLWVASAAAPFMINATPAEAGVSILARIDLARGRVTASYQLAGSGLLNDLSRGKDGSVYVTESRGGTIYVLRPTHNELQPLFPQDTFESPNGILVLPDGNLLVADFDGLALVIDPAAPKPRIQRLSTPDDLYLGGIDGLAWSEGRVVAIQNLVGRSRIWLLSVDQQRGRISRALVLMRGHPDFLNPTTGVVVGRSFRFIADTKLQTFLPDGTLSALPAGRKGHRVITLPTDPP